MNAPVTPPSGPEPENNTQWVNSFIDQKIATAPIFPLVQNENMVTYLVEIFCSDIPPEAITSYLNAKVQDGTLQHGYQQVPLRRYNKHERADDPAAISSPIYGFHVKVDLNEKENDLNRLGIEKNKLRRTHEHVGISMNRSARL